MAGRPDFTIGVVVVDMESGSRHNQIISTVSKRRWTPCICKGLNEDEGLCGKIKVRSIGTE